MVEKVYNRKKYLEKQGEFEEYNRVSKYIWEGI